MLQLLHFVNTSLHDKVPGYECMRHVSAFLVISHKLLSVISTSGPPLPQRGSDFCSELV